MVAILATSLTQIFDSYRPTQTGTNTYGEAQRMDSAIISNGACRLDILNAQESLEIVGRKVKQGAMMYVLASLNVAEGDYVEVEGCSYIWRVLSAPVLYRLKDGTSHRECILVVE